MVSKEKVENAIRANQAKDQITRSQDDAEASRAEEEEKKKDAEIDALLPEFLESSIFGRISYRTFKKAYESIWEQISDKTHLARGYCVHSAKPEPGLEISFRTMRSNETAYLNTLVAKAEDYGDFVGEELKYRSARLAVAITGFGEMDLPDLGEALSKSGLKEWYEVDAVQSRLEWLGKLPEELVNSMSGILTDIVVAYRLAIRENLKNQLAPLLRS